MSQWTYREPQLAEGKPFDSLQVRPRRCEHRAKEKWIQLMDRSSIWIWDDGVKTLAPVVQTLDSVIHRIKIYPLDNAIDFPNTYPLDSDLSGG